MGGEVKINIFYNDDGEEIEKMLADYLLLVIKTNNIKY